MSVFLTNVKNEYIKLAKRKKYLVFLIIEVVICVCVLLVQMAANNVINSVVTVSVGNMSMGMLTFFIIVYVPLIIFMCASDLFGGEMNDNSIKAVLMRPISRGKVFSSKTLAIILFAAQYLVALLLITTILQLVSDGSVVRFWSNLGAYLLDLIPMVVVVFMAVLINQIPKGGSLSMFLCILIYVVLYVVGILVPTASGMLFTGYMQWHSLIMGASIPITAMLSKVGILCGYALLMGAVGYYIFDRRDF